MKKFCLLMFLLVTFTAVSENTVAIKKLNLMKWQEICILRRNIKWMNASMSR